MNLPIGVDDRLAERRGRFQFIVLAVGQGDVVHGQLAGQFPGRMSPHAVGHHEEVPPLLIVVKIRRQHDIPGILVILPAHTDISDGGVADAFVEVGHVMSVGG